MKTLGYILTKNKNKINFDFIKVVNDFSLVEKDKPCLIVGLSEAIFFASDKFSILHKQINANLFWTFSRTEKRNEFEIDINYFYNNIINNKINNIKYTYINLININFNILKRLFKLCNSTEGKYIYIWNDMCYILCNEYNVVGFSLKLCEYCGIRKEKVIQKIMLNKNNIICDNEECINSKLRNKIKNKQFIVPYIMFIMEK